VIYFACTIIQQEVRMFWIVEKSDGAILGFVSGSRSQRCVDGPFDSYDEAMDAKSGYRRHGCTWYTIVESDEEPKYHTDTYRFVDADREFDDCYGSGYEDW
jgi:hypothetical protein